MSSPFNKSFNSKSPLKGHRKIQRQINRAKRNWDGPGDFYEEHASLYEAKTRAEAAHSNARTEESDATIREDEDAARNSAAEMSSPLHGYREASDMVDSNPPTAHMWGNVFQSFSNMAQQIIAKRSTPEAKAKRLAKRQKRMEDREQTTGRKKRIANVKNKKEAAEKEVTAKNEKQALYNTWLAGAGSTASEQEKTNKKQSLGLT
tara:strand:+ start:444 stop:1058 length:615 start_codon:yes stop_codon:yes gene_type:complete